MRLTLAFSSALRSIGIYSIGIRLSVEKTGSQINREGHHFSDGLDGFASFEIGNLFLETELTLPENKKCLIHQRKFPLYVKNTRGG
jgi:hypothetical protein